MHVELNFLAPTHYQGWDDLPLPLSCRFSGVYNEALPKDSKQSVNNVYLAHQEFILLTMKTTMYIAIRLAKSDNSLVVKGVEKQAFSDTVGGIKW